MGSLKSLGVYYSLGLAQLKFESPESSEESLFSVPLPTLSPYPLPKKERERKKRHIKSEAQPVGICSETCSTHVSYAYITTLEHRVFHPVCPCLKNKGNEISCYHDLTSKY